MDIVFDIVDNIKPGSIIILTVIFTEKYNVSIGKDGNSITVYFYNSDERQVLKFFGSPPTGPKYLQMKKFIQEQIDNIQFHHITGITSVENKKYLEKYFITSENQISDIMIDINKYFI